MVYSYSLETGTNTNRIVSNTVETFVGICDCPQYPIGVTGATGPIGPVARLGSAEMQEIVNLLIIIGFVTIEQIEEFNYVTVE
ncbi:hypothetical protein, partial [Clostridium sp.]|uniref:hypothetical protein n=1 Tax=Clostridium sp. TaxID=1506 RepID=UPI003BB1355A